MRVRRGWRSLATAPSQQRVAEISFRDGGFPRDDEPIGTVEHFQDFLAALAAAEGRSAKSRRR